MYISMGSLTINTVNSTLHTIWQFIIFIYEWWIYTHSNDFSIHFYSVSYTYSTNHLYPHTLNGSIEWIVYYYINLDNLLLNFIIYHKLSDSMTYKQLGKKRY